MEPHLQQMLSENGVALTPGRTGVLRWRRGESSGYLAPAGKFLAIWMEIQETAADTEECFRAVSTLYGRRTAWRCRLAEEDGIVEALAALCRDG